MATARTRPTFRRRLVATVVALIPAFAALLAAPGGAQAANYVPVSGAGSTWSQNALDQWRRNVNQYGLVINYQGTGSSDGRNQFRNGTVDFAVSEIPYGLSDGGVVDNPPTRKYAYMPIVAGGTSFMYNLKIAGQRVTNLRLSGASLAGIFTDKITQWNDPAIKVDNPGLALPARKIVPVVRSDGSGTTAQFTTWMAHQFPSMWNDYCARAGRSTPCGTTSNYPVIAGTGFTAQSGSLGVSGYVSQSSSEGAITYVEYSYALNTGFPIAKILNAAGYYTEPTASNVAVALLKAQINNDPKSPNYLTQILDGVYNSTDPRTYPVSSYSYMIIPTAAEGSFNTDKGRSLGAFAYYFLCEGQQQAPVLGYSPLPINLVQAGLSQVRKIPGVDAQTVDIKKCNNPTFSADGSNTLANTAPQPPACDKKGPSQCATGTGGAKAISTQTTTTNASGVTTTTGGAGGTTTTTAGGGATGGGSGLTPGATQAGSGGAGGSTAVATGGLSVTNVNAIPVNLDGSGGWGSSQSMVILTIVLLLALVLGPPLLSRYLAGRKVG